MAGPRFLHLLKPAAFAACVFSVSFVSLPAHAQDAVAGGADPAVAARKFADFVRDFRATALADGIRPEVYDRAMAGAQLRPTVTAHNQNQPEFIKPIQDYLSAALSAQRIAAGRKILRRYPRTLRRLEVRYGVPRQVLVAVWGMETRYGKIMGHHSIFSALATLSSDGPRTGFARRELLAALHIMQDQDLSPDVMQSSWAGAFGQTQFIPTTFRRYAVDGDGDGRINLWSSWPDALASTAHLLVAYGWKRGASWGREVVLPSDFAWENADLTIVKPLSAWRAMGVRAARGHLPDTAETAAILLPAGADGPAFLVRGNFRAILHYNHAAAYALAVSLLSERLKGRAVPVAPWPKAGPPLTRDDVMTMQMALNLMDYHAGKPDGLIGSGTRAAIRAWQKAHARRPDGFITRGQYLEIRDDAAAVAEVYTPPMQ